MFMNFINIFIITYLLNILCKGLLLFVVHRLSHLFNVINCYYYIL